MTQKNAERKSTLVFLGLLLIGLIAVYAYFKWKNNSPSVQAVQAETEAAVDTVKDTFAKADTITHTIAKEKDKRVMMDISDPLDPDYPIAPIDPMPPDSVLRKMTRDESLALMQAQGIITPEADSDRVYEVVEEMPTFIGGDKAFYEFAAKNIVYPAKDKEAGNEGTVYVSGIIEREGTLSNVKVIRAFSEAAGAEALRVAKLTRWSPGKLHGKPVRVKINLPFKFRLQ